MIDIHNHVLYGLDDGAQDLETSIAMARAAIENGITHLVCSPHANDDYPFKPEVIAERIAELRDSIGDELTLGLGCDMHLSYDNIDDQFHNPTKYTINGKQYLLIEFPSLFIPQQISDSIYRMCAMGVVPIITHPERNPVLVENPERMVPWLRSGCLIQLTAGSILGEFGKHSEAACRSLLEKNWVDIVSSDAHNVTSRPFCMQQAHARIEQLYGVETADRLCIHNPHAVFYGEATPPRPKSRGLREDAPPKGLLGRFFSHS
jgi:protein-tyrosine phosphatase